MTVLHIDDDPLWSDIVGKILGKRSDVVYVGRATTGEEGLALCRDKHASIVLLDLILPDVDGFAVLDRLQALSPSPKVILFSCRTDDFTMYRVASGAVLGFVAKTIRFPLYLDEALYAVARDEPYICPAGREAMRRFRRTPDAFHKILSDHEIALVSDFAVGASDEEIARCRSLSRHTVHSHRTRIMAKLGLHGTRELLYWAMRTGFQVQLGKVPLESRDRETARPRDRETARPRDRETARPREFQTQPAQVALEIANRAPSSEYFHLNR